MRECTAEGPSSILSLWRVAILVITLKCTFLHFPKNLLFENMTIKRIFGFGWKSKEKISQNLFVSTPDGIRYNEVDTHTKEAMRFCNSLNSRLGRFGEIKISLWKGGLNRKEAICSWNSLNSRLGRFGEIKITLWKGGLNRKEAICSWNLLSSRLGHLRELKNYTLERRPQHKGSYLFM